MFTKQIILIASALVAHSTASCIHGTSLHKREELPGGKVKVSDFGYTGLLGPLNWAGLKAENSPCSASKVQSPINIDDTIGVATEKPVIEFPNVESAEFENLGTTLEVIVNGTTKFAGQDFTLKQFHFHTPSEHRIAEEYFPLEMHMVHEAADGSGAIAVMAVTFQLSEDGSTTDLLTAVTKNLAEVTNPGTVTTTGPLDFTALTDHLQTKSDLFQYTGSLTTPPCAEGLTFLVTKTPLPIDVKTFNAMKSVIKFNSRYTQNSLNETNLLGVAAAQVNGGGAEAPAECAPAKTTAPAAEAPSATSAPEAPEDPATTPAHEAPATTPAHEAPATTPAHEAPATTPAHEAPAASTTEPSAETTAPAESIEAVHPTPTERADKPHAEDDGDNDVDDDGEDSSEDNSEDSAEDDDSEHHCIFGACHRRPPVAA